jgi:hypothetical protein
VICCPMRDEPQPRRDIGETCRAGSISWHRGWRSASADGTRLRLIRKMVRTWVGIAGTSQGTDVPCDISDVTTNEMRPAFEEGTGHATQIVINGPSHGLFDESPYGLGNDRSGIARVSPDVLRNIAYYTIRIEPDERNASPSGTLLDGSGGVEVMIPRGVEVQETSPGNFLVRGPVDDSVLSHTNLIRLVTAILAARDGLADF